MRKGKRKFERKRKRYKLCRDEMDVTEELKIVGLLPTVNKSFVLLLAINLFPEDRERNVKL